MAKKKTEEQRPMCHQFCYMEQCKNYVKHVIDEKNSFWVCDYTGHEISLGCLGACPKERI